MVTLPSFSTSANEQGDRAIRAYLEEIVVLLLDEVKTLPIKAILLDGSLCAGDGVVWTVDGQPRIMSDADILIICQDDAEGIAEAQQCLNRRLVAGVSKTMTDTWIGTEAQLRAAIVPKIARINFMQNHKVLWGNADWLNLVPTPMASAIPHDDLVRLLMNRSVEQLWLLLLYLEGRTTEWEVLYHSVKAVLDTALVQLLLRGEYQYQVARRVQRLLEMWTNDRSALAAVGWLDAEHDLQYAMRIRLDPFASMSGPLASANDRSCLALDWWLRAATALMANVRYLLMISKDSKLGSNTNVNVIELARAYFRSGTRHSVGGLRQNFRDWRQLGSVLTYHVSPPSAFALVPLSLAGTPLTVAYLQTLWLLRSTQDMLVRNPKHRSDYVQGVLAQLHELAVTAEPDVQWQYLPGRPWAKVSPNFSPQWLRLAKQAVTTWDVILMGGQRYVFNETPS